MLQRIGLYVFKYSDHHHRLVAGRCCPGCKATTLQQYAGRLHREHATKSDVRIIDFVDTGHPALLRMWEKRQRGY